MSTRTGWAVYLIHVQVARLTFYIDTQERNSVFMFLDTVKDSESCFSSCLFIVLLLWLVCIIWLHHIYLLNVEGFEENCLLRFYQKPDETGAANVIPPCLLHPHQPAVCGEPTFLPVSLSHSVSLLSLISLL